MVVRILVLITSICVLGLASSTNSQSPGERAESSDDASPIPLLTIDFAGGTANQYVEAVRKAAKESNIVVMADLSVITMPPTQLKNVDIGAALRVLQAIREQPGKQVRIVVAQDQGEFGRIAGARPIYAIDAEVEPTGPLAGGRHHETIVFDMSEILADGPSAADVLTAVETAIVMHKADAPAAEVRFHEATKLLIARGPSTQVQAIREVLGNLRGAAQSSQLRDEAQRRMQEIVGEHQAVQNRLQEARGRVAELEAANQLLERELEMMRAELEDSRRDRAEADMQLRAALQELHALKNRTKPPG